MKCVYCDKNATRNHCNHITGINEALCEEHYEIEFNRRSDERVLFKCESCQKGNDLTPIFAYVLKDNRHYICINCLFSLFAKCDKSIFL